LRSIPATPEVLDHYRGVLADEPGGQLVQAVAAGVGHGGVEFRDAGLGRAPPLRGHLSRALVGADTAGGLALQATQLREGDLQVARVGDDLLGGEHRQGRDAEVDTHHRIRPGRGRVVAFDLDRERAEPPPAPVRHRRRPNPRPTVLDMPGELAGGLVGAHQGRCGAA
jgi:hypothetical protein